MLASRAFAAPARQCLRQARPVPRWAPMVAARTYAVASEDRVAKFKGTKGNDGKYTVTLIEGDGIGPEIAQSVKDIYSAANVRTSAYPPAAEAPALTATTGAHQVGERRRYPPSRRWQDHHSPGVH